MVKRSLTFTVTFRRCLISAALKHSGIVWDVASLDKWLASAQRDVPGVAMPVSIGDE
jgi:cytochrome c2